MTQPKRKQMEEIEAKWDESAVQIKTRSNQKTHKEVHF